MNYRHEARSRLEAAKTELSSNDGNRLKYAALDLRMAMEAITYDRALAYKDEFPPDEYQTWQPRRVMAVLLEIDSHADADRSLAVGPETEYGLPAPVMHSLGTEQVLGMSDLKRHYDALGSYLHLPSLKQTKAGEGIDTTRLRKRCEDIADIVSAVLSSPIFNITLGQFARFECARCQRPIRKRLSWDKSEISAECFECHASYALTTLGAGQFEIRPKRQDVNCGGDGCSGTVSLWEADLQVGKYWQCPVCQGRNILTLALTYEHEPDDS